MQSQLRSITAAGVQRCRQDGVQIDVVEAAYTACLLEEQQAWSPSHTSTKAAVPSTAEARPLTEGQTFVPESSSSIQTSEIQQMQQPAHQRLSLCLGTQLPEAAAEAMTHCLHQELMLPADAAAAATARLQIQIERSFVKQQKQVEAELKQQAAAAADLARTVAYTKVDPKSSGLCLYQSKFHQVVDYVCAAARIDLGSGTPEMRAQVSAAVESVLPLSSLAYFLTLPAQERLQQLESVALITLGILLLDSHAGSVALPVRLSTDTQLLQAQRLLSAVQEAAIRAEAVLGFCNRPQLQGTSQTNPKLAEVASAYLNSPGSLSSLDTVAATGISSSSAAKPQLGSALFCCQAAVTLRALAVDLAAGMRCCTQLQEELFLLLTQAAEVTGAVQGAAVLKDHVYPLFESAGRMHLALKGELRLLLVRNRLWESITEALEAAASLPGVPKVLGKPIPSWQQPPRHSASSSSGTNTTIGQTISGSGAPAKDAAGVLVDPGTLPVGMEYLAPPAPADATVDGLAGSAATKNPSASPEDLLLALSGICPVSIVCSEAAGGATSPAGAGGEVMATDASEKLLVGCLARPECGCIRYAGKMYGFSSPAALTAFIAAPVSILEAVRQAAHNTPLLMHMLGLTADSTATAPPAAVARVHPASPVTASELPLNGSHPDSDPCLSKSLVSMATSSKVAGAPYAAAAAAGNKSTKLGSAGGRWRMPPVRGLLELFEVPIKVDAGTQTVTHVVEQLHDANYEWNEWALRRRIIALANLRLKSTHSAQTVSSGFRREGSSQTWLPKEAAVQTRVNKGSSVPRKLRYVTGLRGAPDTKMKVISLELDVHGKGVGVKPGC